MNNYKNEYGCHTPQMTKQIIEYVNEKTSLNWEDSSWHNDLVDSISYGEGEQSYQLMLPNSFINDEDRELFNYFTILDDNQDTLIMTIDIHEIIEYINKELTPLLNEDMIQAFKFMSSYANVTTIKKEVTDYIENCTKVQNVENAIDFIMTKIYK